MALEFFSSTDYWNLCLLIAEQKVCGWKLFRPAGEQLKQFFLKQLLFICFRGFGTR